MGPLAVLGETQYAWDEKTIGHLYESPQAGATVPFYGCKNGTVDYFVTPDPTCNGFRILGTQGYGYASPVAGVALTPLCGCFTGVDHFVSTDVNCEGHAGASVPGTLLGYGLP